MVAIWLRGRDETTLKYFYLENGRVRLQPANPTMKPIFIEDPSIVEIQGKVVMVVRKVIDTPLAVKPRNSDVRIKIGWDREETRPTDFCFSLDAGV